MQNYEIVKKYITVGEKVYCEKEQNCGTKRKIMGKTREMWERANHRKQQRIVGKGWSTVKDKNHWKE